MLFNDAQNEKRIEKQRKRSTLILLLIMLLVIALPLAAIAWFSGVNDEHNFSKARRALEKGNYLEAVDCALNCPKYEKTALLLAEAVKGGTSRGASASENFSLAISDLKRVVKFANSGGFSSEAVNAVETAVMNAGEEAFKRGEFDSAEDVFTIVIFNGSALKTRAAACNDAVSGVNALEQGEYTMAEKLLRSASTFSAAKPYYQTACRELVLIGAKENNLELVREHVKTKKNVELDEEISAEIMAAVSRTREVGDPILAMGFLDLLPNDSYDEGLRLQLEYERGIQHYNAGDYYSAEKSFLRSAAIDGADDMLKKARYALASEYFQDGKYYQAISIFEELGDYEDAKERAIECNSLQCATRYALASEYFQDGKYYQAISIFEELGDYGDAKERIIECNYLQSAKDVDVYYIRIEGLDEDAYVDFGVDGLRTDKYRVLQNYDRAIEFFEQHPGYKNTDELLKEAYYKKARIIDDEDPEAALELYKKIPDYKDVAEKIAEDSKLMRTLRIRKGDTLSFGRFYINNAANLEPITWHVLRVSDGCALLISNKALSFSPYFSKEDEIKHEPDDFALTMYRYSDRYETKADVYKAYLGFRHSTASHYLNGEFSDTAFTAEEKACITRKADANVFLLNSSQAERFFNSAASLICSLTPYAKQIGEEAGAPAGAVSGNAVWLLGDSEIGDYGITGVYYVSSTGHISEAKTTSDFNKYTVFALRPCVWVNVEKLLQLTDSQ